MCLHPGPSRGAVEVLMQHLETERIRKGQNLLKMPSTVCPETTVHAIPNYSTLGCIPNEGECLEPESLPDS